MSSIKRMFHLTVTLFEAVKENLQPIQYVDPAMIGVLVGMALMFVIICVVLRLFSRYLRLVELFGDRSIWQTCSSWEIIASYVLYFIQFWFVDWMLILTFSGLGGVKIVRSSTHPILGWWMCHSWGTASCCMAKKDVVRVLVFVLHHVNRALPHWDHIRLVLDKVKAPSSQF